MCSKGHAIYFLLYLSDSNIIVRMFRMSRLMYVNVLLGSRVTVFIVKVLFYLVFLLDQIITNTKWSCGHGAICLLSG